MKLLAINGSYRGDKGNTRLLIDTLFDGAKASGAECEVITLARCKMHRCLGCNRCRTAEQFLRCVYDEKDDVRSIFNRMAEADMIIYATPVYLFGISALLKTFLDRLNATGDNQDLRLSKSGLLFHHIDAAICSKPFVTLVNCGNVEYETPQNVLAYFRTFSRFMDAPQVGVLVRNGSGFCGYGTDPERASMFPKIQEVYAAYRQAGMELAQQGFISASTQRKANQEIIPVRGFGLLKRLPFPFLKRRLVKAASKMRLPRPHIGSTDIQEAGTTIE